MKLEILMSCMHQSDDSLVKSSQITGDVLVINQTDCCNTVRYPTEHGTAVMCSVTDRGLTKSRNLAIERSQADICMLCDDDEIFQQGYEKDILDAYASLPQADLIIFKMVNRPPSFPDQICRLRFPKTLKVSSWQISFRRTALVRSGVRFDPLLGAGSGNGAEEELKFLLDCQKAGLCIYYVPVEIASVRQTESTWFQGFTPEFFEDRGATTRYILGAPMAVVYALYYIFRKRSQYRGQITFSAAMKAIFRGIRKNRIMHQRKALQANQ